MTSEILAIFACTVQVYADLRDFTMYSLQKLLYYFHFSKHNLVVQNLSFTCLRWKGNFFNKTFVNVFFSWTINYWPLWLEHLHCHTHAFTTSRLQEAESAGQTVSVDSLNTLTSLFCHYTEMTFQLSQPKLLLFLDKYAEFALQSRGTEQASFILLQFANQMNFKQDV